MTRYRVKFYKDLLSSDGHPFRCLQKTLEVQRARSAERALEAAQHRYARLAGVSTWMLYADAAEIEAVEGNGRPAA